MYVIIIAFVVATSQMVTHHSHLPYVWPGRRFSLPKKLFTPRGIRATKRRKLCLLPASSASGTSSISREVTPSAMETSSVSREVTPSTMGTSLTNTSFSSANISPPIPFSSSEYYSDEESSVPSSAARHQYGIGCSHRGIRKPNIFVLRILQMIISLFVFTQDLNPMTYSLVSLSFLVVQYTI